MKKNITITFFLLSSIILFGQKNLIYNKIQNVKKNGKEFSAITNVFKSVSKSVSKKQSELKHFKNPNEVFFLNYDANKILNVKQKNISLAVPVGNQAVILELSEVPDSFYNYIITTSDGKTYSPNRSNKHYRGIIKNDPESIVAISFYKNNVIGMISNNIGNYSISKINNDTKFIVYNDKNLQNNTKFNCETENDYLTVYKKSVLSQQSKTFTKSSSKCVKIYFETGFEILNHFGNTLAVEEYVSGLFNQVSTIYENENIITLISEIHIWTFTDPYNGSITNLLNQFQSNTGSFNGDLGQLLKFGINGGGKAAGYNGICNSNTDLSLSVANITSTYLPFPTYSYSTKLVAHELGHLFGSKHTHRCVWNGNNTQIDDCGNKYFGDLGITPEGAACYNTSNPILPSSGTIMSYCDFLGSVGVNLNLGFGTQPGNIIRNRVLNGSCLDICETCSQNLTINQNVNTGQTDIQESSNTITATNIIFNGATAEYDAGTTVFLNPGFNAKSGSNFRAYIEGCQNTSTKPSKKQVYQNEEVTINKTSVENIKIYPNPTKNTITIESTKEVKSWLITSAYGKSHFTGNTTKIINMSNLPNGIYFLKAILKDGNVVMKKIIKN